MIKHLKLVFLCAFFFSSTQGMINYEEIFEQKKAWKTFKTFQKIKNQQEFARKVEKSRQKAQLQIEWNAVINTTRAGILGVNHEEYDNIKKDIEKITYTRSPCLFGTYPLSPKKLAKLTKKAPDLAGSLWASCVTRPYTNEDKKRIDAMTESEVKTAVNEANEFLSSLSKAGMLNSNYCEERKLRGKEDLTRYLKNIADPGYFNIWGVALPRKTLNSNERICIPITLNYRDSTILHEATHRQNNHLHWYSSNLLTTESYEKIRQLSEYDAEINQCIALGPKKCQEGLLDRYQGRRQLSKEYFANGWPSAFHHNQTMQEVIKSQETGKVPYSKIPNDRFS